MTRLAILADVHGNLAALEAVLADLERLVPDEVLVGGDLVGRGPQGAAVVRRIQALGWPCVRGNHEDYLLAFRRREVPAAWLAGEEWAASRWMASELGDEEAAYLAQLPLSIASRRAPEVTLVHGTPRSNDEGIGPWTVPEELDRHLRAIPGGVLACAHTHRPLVRRRPGGLVVNTGSVGLPFNRDRRAQYALLRREADGGWAVEHRSVAYDLGRTLTAYETSGFLAAGRVTARLLRLELEEAAPFLVPFLKWSEAAGLPPAVERVAQFLREYDPDAPLAPFFRRLRERARARAEAARPAR